MKKIFTLLVISFALFSAQAQINFDNADFERWTSSTSAQSWNSLGISMGFTDLSLCDISRTTDAFSGEYAMQIKAKPLPELVSSLIGISSFAVPGFITNAKVDMETLLSLLQDASSLLNSSDTSSDDLSLEMLEQFAYVLTDGLDISDAGTPTLISGKYKLELVSDQEVAAVMALCVKVEGETRTIVGGGLSQLLATDDNYQDFSLDIMNTDNSNELIFIAVSATMDTLATSFGALKLDNLSISFSTESNISEIENQQVKIYPNPSFDKTFRIDCEENQDVVVYDVLGRTINKVENYIPNSLIKIEKEGSYIIKVGDRHSKLIIK